MTLKEINSKFSIHGVKHKGKYLVFSRTEHGMRMVHKYLCLINKRGAKFFIDGFKPTGNLIELEGQINKYIKALPYDSEYYMPLYREGVFEEHIIHDYLNSLNFKHQGNDFYTLEDKNIYQYKTSNIDISFGGLSWHDGLFFDKDKNSTNVVRIFLHTGRYSWVETNVARNVNSIKEGIDSLLKPLLITDSVNLFTKSEQLKNVGDIDIYLKGITESLDIASVDYKATLKHKLQEVLNTL